LALSRPQAASSLARSALRRAISGGRAWGAELGDRAFDVGLQLLTQLFGPVVADRFDFASVRLDLSPVDHDRPDPKKTRLLGKQKDLQDRRFGSGFVSAPKRRDRVAIWMRVGGDKSHPDIPVGRPLDPPGTVWREIDMRFLNFHLHDTPSRKSEHVAHQIVVGALVNRLE
jgi:hypothetical protein